MQRSMLFAFLPLAVLAMPSNALSDVPGPEFAKCAAVKAPAERLSCYDEIGVRLQLDRPKAETATSGKWRLTTSQSKIDDSTTVTLSITSESDIEGWLRKERPTLILRCKENETDAYIVTGMPPNVEYGNHDGATVLIRYDDKKAFNVVMGRSTSGDALFFSVDAIGQIKKMEQHSKMLFQFTPFNASPVMTEFQISGLSEPLSKLRTACNW